MFPILPIFIFQINLLYFPNISPLFTCISQYKTSIYLFPDIIRLFSQVELGRQLLLRSKNRDAIKCFRNAMKIDETNITALTGLVI